MKKYFLILMLFAPSLGFSQTTTSSSGNGTTAAATPTPAPTPVGRQSQRISTAAPVANNREFELLSNLEDEIIRREEARKREEKVKLARQMVTELYRKPSKKEMLTVAVDNDLREKYADFLKLEDTGLVRLLNDTGCAENTNVVVASDNCLKNTMPGSGSAFSFRVNTYRIPHLADLMLSQNDFVTTGNWLHGVLANIGDIGLESVGLQTAGVKFINDFPSAIDFETAKEIDSKFIQGFKDGNFIYSRLVRAQENQTYVLRSIAYRGNVYKSANGLTYNELDYDKRKDVLIAFRVVRKHQDGSATILWKRLASKDSPKLIVKTEARK